MRSAYEAAKRVALGLETERKLPVQQGEDLWNISFDDGFGLTVEMPFQNFERGFDPPDEQTAQKVALIVKYQTEYTADQKAAQAHCDTLERLLEASDLDGLRRFLSDAPLSQWLSLIFLDGDRLRTGLVPKLESADSACRAEFSAATEQALNQLVEYKKLLETLKECC